MAQAPEKRIRTTFASPQKNEPDSLPMSQIPMSQIFSHVPSRIFQLGVSSSSSPFLQNLWPEKTLTPRALSLWARSGLNLQVEYQAGRSFCSSSPWLMDCMLFHAVFFPSFFSHGLQCPLTTFGRTMGSTAMHGTTPSTAVSSELGPEALHRHQTARVQYQGFHFGIGEFTTHRTYFCGWIESNVHWGYGG